MKCEHRQILVHTRLMDTQASNVGNIWSNIFVIEAIFGPICGQYLVQYICSPHPFWCGLI